MDEQERIRKALERCIDAVERRPSLGRATACTRVTLKPGLECEIVDAQWKLTAGVQESAGGTNAGPDPGVLGRGALGSSLAVGYATWAARMGVPFDRIGVEVEAEYDRRGELGVADEVAPGYSQIRYVVTVESPAPEEIVRLVLDTADRYNAYRDLFAQPHELRREVRVLSRGA